jgi:hypothetical protein
VTSLPVPNEAGPNDAGPNEAGPEESVGTGVSAADDASRQLAELDEAPLADHVEIYEDVHRRLQEGLADLDEQ